MDTTKGIPMDEFSNVNAQEGVTLCECGCKYWENDKCIDCGQLVEVVQNRLFAKGARYMNRVRLNTQLTTMLYYNYPWVKDAPVTDLVDINSEFGVVGGRITL